MFYDISELYAYIGRPFCIGEDGAILGYAELIDQCEAFRSRFTAGRGVILIEASKSVNAIVALIASLQAGMPCYLASTEQVAQRDKLAAIPFKYVYESTDDRFEVIDLLDGTDFEIHPELAMLLSTSGSTGTAKSVRLSRSNIDSNARAIAAYLDLNPDDRAPTNLPLHYSYGLSVVTSHLAVGGSLFITERSMLEAGFWTGFDAHKCTSFAAVPHVIEMLETSPFKTAERPSLRYVTQAGGKLSAERVEAMTTRAQAEGWQFFVMYGQTEASPRMAYLPPHLAAQYPGYIGHAIPGGRFELVDDDGAAIEDPDTPGELVYHGPNVMMGYASCAEDLSRGAELEMLTTGDIALRNEVGLYRIVGRKSRFIKPFGLRISLDEVDAWLAARGYAALAGAGQQEHLCLLIEPSVNAPEIRDAVSVWLGIPANAIQTIPVATLPYTANGKPDGQAIAQLIRQAEEPPQDRMPSSALAIQADRFVQAIRRWMRSERKPTAETDVAEAVTGVFQSHFPGTDILPQHSFADLGGDSLRYVGVAMDLEQVLGQLPQNWERVPIKYLMVERQAGPFHIDSATFLRCLAIVLVASSHLDLMNYGGGGAYLLLTLAGYSFSAFTLPRILKERSIRPILSIIFRVVVPTIAYIAIVSATIFHLDYRTLLLISNWYSPNLPGTVSYWYIEVYVQIYIIIALLMVIPSVRQVLTTTPFLVTCVFTILATILLLFSQYFWDASHLYRRLPHMLLWMFAIGMAVEAARHDYQRLAASLLAVIARVCFLPLSVPPTIWILGVLLLIWLPVIEMPRWAITPVRMISGASLFIYLTHFQFGTVVKKVTGNYPVGEVIVAVAGGVMIWRLYERAIRVLAQQAYNPFSLRRREAFEAGGEGEH